MIARRVEPGTVFTFEPDNSIDLITHLIFDYMKHFRLSASLVLLAGIGFQLDAGSPAMHVARAVDREELSFGLRVSERFSPRGATPERRVENPVVRDFSAGMPAPRIPSMRTVSAAGANLFGAVPGEGSFVSISVGSEISLSSLYKNASYLNPNGGAVYAGDKYISVEYDESPYLTASYMTFFKFTGTYFAQQSSTYWTDDEAWWATDMAYDPTTKTVYGYFNFHDGSTSYFGKLDEKNNPVKIFAGSGWAAMACDQAGTLYGLTKGGVLHRIAKETGASSKIEQTGVTPGTSGSMAFGADGKLYWVNYSASAGSMLYQVDTKSGRAALVGAIPGGKEIVGLCTYGATSVAATPSAPSGAELVFADGELSGKIRFTIPEFLADGSKGSGEASWSVATGGVAIQSGKAAYGSVVEAPVSVTQAGDYTFLITLSNENGSAPGVSVSGWIGQDDRMVLTPAFNFTFDTEDKLKDFTIVDENKDGKTWKYYNGRVRIVYNSSKAMDDWLISPPVELKAGRLYELNALFSCYADSEERIEVKLGSSPTVEYMTTQVIDKSTLQTDYNKPDTFTGKIKVETSGRYYIGFHGCSDEDKNTLFLHSFSIDEGTSAAAPGVPTSLAAVPAADCALEATVSCVAPEVDINGNKISSLTKLEIMRDDELLTTETPVVPGQKIEYVDKGQSLTHGQHVYSVRAYNDAGVGESAQTTVYVGVPVPASPASASFRQTSPGMVEVRWDAVSADDKGNKIPDSQLSYTLVVVYNGQSSIVKENIKGTTYSYKVCEPDAAQDLYYYGVRAVTAAGFSDAALTDMLPVGKSYAMPFVESFAEGNVSGVWGTKRLAGVQTSWKIYNSQPTLPAQDDDNGFAAMSGSASGDRAILSSGNISLEGAVKPEVSYWYYALASDCNNTIELMIDDGGGVLKSVRSDVTGGTEGWKKAHFDLTPYIGKTIRVAFQATIQTHTLVAIDNISIRESMEHNLTASRFTVPSEFDPDKDYDLSLVVSNNGRSDASGWKAELLLNGNVVESADGPSLKSDASATVGFKVNHNVTSPETLRYSARVVYDKDADMTDNVSQEVEARLRLNSYPAPDDLKVGKTAQDVKLDWSAPSGMADVATTESFEEWKHLSTTPSGGWTFHNLDSGVAGGFKDTQLAGIDNASVGFFVLDASAPVFGNNGTFAAKSGKMYLASMYGYNPQNGEAVANDDWMVTPELSGSAQTITFYAKSYNAQYPESFQVLVSKTDTEPGSFTMIGEDKKVPGTWNLYTFDVPEGTKYFAIRCISNDCFMFMVDDVTFHSAAGSSVELKGYNIYRDGVRLNASPVADTYYTDLSSAGASHDYHVSAVYDRGESKAAFVRYEANVGVDQVAGSSVSLTAFRSGIAVSGAAGMPVSVVSADGKTVYSGSCLTEMERIRLIPGMYVVRVGHEVRKVMVP